MMAELPNELRNNPEGRYMVPMLDVSMAVAAARLEELRAEARAAAVRSVERWARRAHGRDRGRQRSA
jgi:hypothetical protein